MRKWLKELRIQAGLSQRSLADLIELDVTSVGKYENGKRRPSPETAMKIAKILGFDWTELFKEEQSEVPKKAV